MADEKKVASVQRALRKVERTKNAFLYPDKDGDKTIAELYEAWQKAHASLGRAIAKANG